MATTTKKGSIVEFPREVGEDAWVDQLMEHVEQGTRDGNVDSFIGFAVMNGAETGVHMGSINSNNAVGAYVLLGALEVMKQRILEAISTSQEN